MTNETKSLNPADLEQELEHFTGDYLRYRNPLNPKVVFTPGVQHLAEQAKAYWLIDAIASWIGSFAFEEAVHKSERIGGMHFWYLKVNQDDKSATLYAEEDQGIEPFIVQTIPFTDFPLEKISIWAGFDGQFWTLYLPSEH